MRWVTLAVLLFSTARGAAETQVTITGATEGVEVCRFQARDRENPFDRWLKPSAITCVAAGSPLTFPPGLWNVFARAHGAISNDPILVDAATAPSTLAFSLVPAATLVLQLPPEVSGVLYLPKHAVAFPVEARTTVPAGEELWLIVLTKGVPTGVVSITALEPGVERVVDAHSVSEPSAVLGWLQVSAVDRAALKSARGVQLPLLAISANGKEVVAASLPVQDALNGAFVLFRGLSAGTGDLRLQGRGWLPSRRSVRIAAQPLTIVREPIPARASTTVMVNWSTSDDLSALDRALGSCDPAKEAPRFELTIARCPEPAPGKPLDPASCSVIRTEPLRTELTFGSVRVDEVPPGTYRAELRYGRLPPFDVIEEVAPLQQRPMAPLQAKYFEAYGDLTRGGHPLADDARVEFPQGGIGFARRGSGEYHAVVKSGLDVDEKVDIVTCSGKRAYVITDSRMNVWGHSRFDIDIPDNTLTIKVIDTFTQRPLPTATLRYEVMARRGSFPLVTREVSQSGDGEEEGTRLPGQFVIKGLPERKLQVRITCPGYKRKDLDSFSMTKSETKEIDVDLVPLGGSEAKIISARPFANGTIFWFSPAGAETERAELAPDGTFHFEQTHYRDETMTVVSQSHPLWIVRAPAVERATPLQVKFPDAVTPRTASVVIAQMPPRVITALGVSIGGLRVPQPALIQHLTLRGTTPLVTGSGPWLIPDLVESGPIDILRGPSGVRRQQQLMDMMLHNFAPVATQRLGAGSPAVVFDGAAR